MEEYSNKGGEWQMNTPISMDGVSAARKILRRANEKREQEEMRLFHAIQEARAAGKEDFDVETFASFYHGDQLLGDRVDNETSDAALESYMRDYYLGHPDVMSVKDYAALLNSNDTE